MHAAPAAAPLKGRAYLHSVLLASARLMATLSLSPAAHLLLVSHNQQLHLLRTTAWLRNIPTNCEYNIYVSITFIEL
jgi:hypothetical protein